MEFLFCPDCFGSNFTENFDCRACQTSLLTGKKITVGQKKRNLRSSGQVVAVSTGKVVRRTIKQRILAGASIFLGLFCLVGVIFQGSFSGSTKSLETVAAQMSAQNELNKFSIETNEKTNLTAITLAQENVKIAADSESFSTVKLLFDCVIGGDTLARTPDEYEITIISKDSDWRDFESAELQFQTEKESLTIKKQTADHLTSGANSLEYISHRISRKDLEKIANSPQINFQIGKYRGQMNFAQQQSLRSFLIATSIDSKIN